MSPLPPVMNVLGALVVWVSLCVLVGALYKHKGRGFVTGFFVSFLLSPILGFAIGVALSRRAAHKSSGETPATASGFTKKCPNCASDVKVEARVCLACHREFTVPETMSALDSYMGSRDDDIRVAALRLICSVDGDVGRGRALKALSDQSLKVRLGGIRILQESGDRSAVPAILGVLGRYDAGRDNVFGYDFTAALEAVQALADVSMIPAIVDALRHSTENRSRQMLMSTLSRLGEPAVLALAGMLDDHYLRPYASNYILEIGAAAVPTLESFARETRGGAASAAAELAGRLKMRR